ncbi:hypothetical protein BJ165DRAFT_1314737, partial [Panaeolus papilionaceus]
APWLALIPTLIDDYLEYVARSSTRVVESVPSVIRSRCMSLEQSPCPQTKNVSVLSTQQVLVNHGLFPTSPVQPQMAVSIDLLHFYAALFERSCDAVNALAHALSSFYQRRGFYLLNNKGQRIKEPFRKGLGYATQWLDLLQIQVEKQLQAALHEADQVARALHAPVCSPSVIILVTFLMLYNNQFQDMRTSSCAQVLSKRCPACFSSATFGRPLARGGDFLIATDGNFHHRHSIHGGSGTPFHEPKNIIPKEFVDRVGDDIDRARNRSRKVTKRSDHCEQSFKAAKEDTRGASDSAKYDDTGLMSLVCRHDIPLFLANIDSPGERQKYSVALILWFFQFVPENATVTVLYDIGCVLDKSVKMVLQYITPHISPRVRFATTAMHAYAHRWSCQLRYNPRLCDGLGLTDGEGVERVWSRMRKLIVLVRSSSRARRLFITDRFIDFIAHDARQRLGYWLRRRLQNVEYRRTKATDKLNAIDKDQSELRSQWEHQRQTQLSKLDTPAQFEKKIDTILALQKKADQLEEAITSAHDQLSRAGRRKRRGRRGGPKLPSLAEKIEGLVSSFQVHGVFPALRDLDETFSRTLLFAHACKIQIRRQAGEVFAETDRLKQASGGKSAALGTKLHQSIRASISKHSASLKTKIAKYNQYCTKLKTLYKPHYKLPLPKPLPTAVHELRAQAHSLTENVCLAASKFDLMDWEIDPATQDGIQALLQIDRCDEELERLQLEADNMCCWFGREIRAAEIALSLPHNARLRVQLTQYRDGLLHLKSEWTTDLVGCERYDDHIEAAAYFVESLLGKPEHLP